MLFVRQVCVLRGRVGGAGGGGEGIFLLMGSRLNYLRKSSFTIIKNLSCVLG